MTNTVFFPGLGLEFQLSRVAFSLLGRNVYWYGVIIAAGFLLAVAYGLWRAPRFSMDPDVITDAIFVVVPSAIVGARAYYVIFNPAVCFTAEGSFSFYRMIAFWDGGLAIYGGIIATVISALLFCVVRKVDFWSGMDITSYGLLIGQVVGRWGNFVNVEAYGGLTTLPWRMCSESIANELWRDGLLGTQEMYQSVLDGALGVHPTFLYESLWNLAGFLLLVLLARIAGRRFNGQMFLTYVIWYGLGRSLIEGLRTDSLYFFGTGIRSSQLLGILSVLGGAALYLFRMKTAGPASPPFRPAAGRGDGDPAAERAPAVRVEPAMEPAPAAEPVQELEPVPAAEPVQETETDPAAEPVQETEPDPAAVPVQETEPVPAAVSVRPEDENEEERHHGGSAD